MKIERSLSATDRALLDSFAFKTKEVKAFTLACIKGLQTGLGLFGPGGTGKSYSVREVFEENGIEEVEPDSPGDDDDEGEGGGGDLPILDYKLHIVHQGRVTPKGLVTKMKKYPQSIHLIEDAETMFDDKNCWGVLRMSLHSQDHSQHSKRRITWVTSDKKGSMNFDFFGSLIIIANRNLTEGPEVEAVKSRCPFLDFNISNEELVAKMKDLCCRGYKEVSPYHLSRDDCFDVLEFMLTTIEEDQKLKTARLNLRLLIHGFKFMVFQKMLPGNSWKEMLHSQLKQEVGASKRSRAQRIKDEQTIARDINSKKWPSQLAKLVEWCKQTGRGIEWADKPEDSPEFKKGFNSAKTDLSRKSK